MEGLKLQWQVTQSYSGEIFVVDFFFEDSMSGPSLRGPPLWSSEENYQLHLKKHGQDFRGTLWVRQELFLLHGLLDFRFFLRGGTYDTETLVSYLTAMGEMETKYLYLAGTERFRSRVRWENFFGRQKLDCHFFRYILVDRRKGRPSRLLELQNNTIILCHKAISNIDDKRYG